MWNVCCCLVLAHLGRRRCQGDVKFFEDEGNPQYYGDIYSGLVRMGGRKRRADQKGVIAIVQGIEAAAWATGTKYAVGDFRNPK
ncbi:MAG: hypothetical protein ACLR8Y_13235 [Alistipes indistinctus]